MRRKAGSSPANMTVEPVSIANARSQQGWTCIRVMSTSQALRLLLGVGAPGVQTVVSRGPAPWQPRDQGLISVVVAAI